MKVGTDGVLLGAWADTTNTNSILDIGTGTGLIALMIAQRSPNSTITAIEVNEQATQQAKQNFSNSRWNEQFSLIHSSFQNFSNTQQFDLIVSNPPFFKVNSTDTSREVARNQASLPMNYLIQKANSLLSSNGKLALILPYDQINEVKEELSNNALFLNRVTTIKGNPNTPTKRVLLEASKLKLATIENELIIEMEERHNYSDNYRNLLRDYLTIF